MDDKIRCPYCGEVIGELTGHQDIDEQVEEARQKHICSDFGGNDDMG